MRPSLPLASLFLLGFLIPIEALAQKTPTDSAVPATYATRAEAEKAAKLFHCTGAHQMGDRWMPCDRHGDAHSH
ncbi:MAG: DUF3721 domain-containing protein [Cyanobacteriota bacterium]|jgi:hypothetical protein|nr:DUF3721 domain-containing protein [Cyanobacteriota bacterium]